ncbi:MAG: AbrB/MazE/SpoVT family DNA-binding domain-containing protein [Anaerolineales bacterium]|nr:AbrB/MazE/SpoVT family DNA-binding domain-containing protein [Anaerolineales bacterium]
MSSLTVKVSKRFQIAVPSAARERLNIRSGDTLIVDIQDGMIVLLPRPENYTDHLAGLHREIWQGIPVDHYIREERDSWEASLED